jgi:hypothetical protein
LRCLGPGSTAVLHTTKARAGDLYADFISLAVRGIEHAGIVFCAASKYSIGELIYALLLVQEALNPDDMRNHIEFI